MGRVAVNRSVYLKVAAGCFAAMLGLSACSSDEEPAVGESPSPTMEAGGTGDATGESGTSEDWTLADYTLEKNSFGNFQGTGQLVNNGDQANVVIGLFLNVSKDGERVASMDVTPADPSAPEIEPGATGAVSLTSGSPFVEGPYTVELTDDPFS